MTGIRDLVGLKDIGEVHFRDTEGLKEIAEIYERDIDGLKLVWSKSDPLSANVPEFIYGASASTSTISVSSSVCTASPIGGSAPYTYSWARTDAGGTWVITNPTGVSTQFRSNVSANSTASATFAVTVTDNNGTVVVSVDVSVTVENFGSFQ